MTDWVALDNFVHAYEWDGFTVTRAEFEPKGRATKELNKELRKYDLKDNKHMGKWALSMDELDRKHVGKLFPGINSLDREDRNKEWRRFLKSPLSEPYRVQRKF